MVSDLEIVAAPVLQRDLFGEVDELAPVALDEVLGGLFESGRLALRDVGAGVRNGPRYKALVAVRSGVPVDLFVVRPPATWGVTMAIRTGPRDYSRHLVTALLARGLRSEGGRVLRSNGEPLPTPEERHVFEFAGIPYLAPELRA